MDDFPRTKLTFAAALLALLLAAWPLLSQFTESSFFVVGFRVKLVACYSLVAGLLSISVYISGWRFLVQREYRLLTRAADAAYAIALVLPPAVALLVGLSTLSFALMAFAASPRFVQALSGLAGVAVGVAGSVAALKVNRILKERASESIARHIETEAIFSVSRAKDLIRQNDYDSAVLDAVRAVELTAQSRLGELGLSDPKKESALRAAGRVLKLSELDRTALEALWLRRHVIAHNPIPVTKDQAFEVLRDAQRLVSVLHTAQPRDSEEAGPRRLADDPIEREAQRKLGLWLDPAGLGGPGETIPGYLFSSTTYGEVAVSPAEQSLMLDKGWIEVDSNGGVRITQVGQAAVN